MSATNSMDRMISKMAKMYPMLILMGLMIVVISFFVGFSNSQTAATYFEADKATREGTLTDERSSMESVGQWLPYFKFLGLGLLLGGIVMALRVIIDRLRGIADQVLDNVEELKRPEVPSPPWYALIMPMLMMIAEIILIVALVIAIGNANEMSDIFSNPVATIDGDADLASRIGEVKATDSWLVPLKFLALSSLFLSIAIGLATIIYVLTEQTKLLDKSINIAGGK